MTEEKRDEMTGRIASEIKPCRHMELWVNALSDDSLTGFARWYTHLHVRGCQKCYAALEALRHLKARLKVLHGAESAFVPAILSPERREALQTALEEVERRQS